MLWKKYRWHVLVAFLLLFFIGMTVGKAFPAEQLAVGVFHSSEKTAERTQAKRQLLLKLLQQLEKPNKKSFEVVIRNQTLIGWFTRDKFMLTGKLDSHDISIERSAASPVLFMDGKPQDSSLLPYAMYTPYEHARMLMQGMRSITPLRIQHPREPNIKGFELQLPPEEVKQWLTLWMGKDFHADQAMNEIVKNATIHYQIWYDESKNTLHQIGIHLQLITSNGKKEDQIVFRF